ncbi:hypothetical protein K4L44_09515 [Halosquirtibacter laminarini]|uniref:Uncharacterized protein n=1 Tax=Halosquirtibacter laminarini TaxID=3374600 RepID=A0AC61NHN5_9BACT|nr:hypothetical protein K4L44_09515 [Prolixibacteraceae bacterium]
MLQNKDLIQYLNLKLTELGQPGFKFDSDTSENQSAILQLTEELMLSFKEKYRRMDDRISAADKRIENFLNDYLKDLDVEVKLPTQTLVLDRPGLARVLSLPPNKDIFKNQYVTTTRVEQGLVNNPRNDKRTTKGTFHIVADGLPVPLDKKEVPRNTFAKLFQLAMQPDQELKTLPFTSAQEEKSEVFTSFLIRPVVCPKVANFIEEKRMEIRFYAPGALVSNIDFVETIFGNAGDPYLAENDAALDPDHWTGHTGCIVLAPHLSNYTKKELGLPHYDDATERQRKDEMCWKEETEKYNDGSPFKLTCRDDRGVTVTLIADNYYGYSKKEVKTQIGYSANLYGLVEEEHAGGAIAFQRMNLGDFFSGVQYMRMLKKSYSFEDVKQTLGNVMEVYPENYGVDKRYPNVFYIQEDANMDIYQGKVTWNHHGQPFHLSLQPGYIFIHPSGHKIHMEKHPSAPSWRLISTFAEGTFCHKPATVSGGGKSEISKSLMNAIIYGSLFVDDFEKDFDLIDQVINYDYSKRWKERKDKTKRGSRSLLSPERSIGSVIKLLTPSEYHIEEYNEFLKTIPDRVKSIVLFIKRLYREKGDQQGWKELFSVDTVNGKQGHELNFNNRKVIASYLRLGFDLDNSWYLHKLRTDFMAAQKVQMEDDISASVVVPTSQINMSKKVDNPSVKFTTNCENFFFQRPDEAIVRGYDKEAEADLTSPNTFISNYEPMDREQAKALVSDAIGFDQYTQPVKDLIQKVANGEGANYFIAPSHPRIIGDGKPTKNPRYLQKRTDKDPFENYITDIGMRVSRNIGTDRPVYRPVNAVLSGRRNNPQDKAAGIRPLSVYNPLHYQELPELLMDFICSLTGKSPSTTGAGTEGALTKGPFNMLSATSDINNSLLSFILTNYQGYSTAAGWVGSENRFDHDISLLVPELWCRMTAEDADANQLIENGSLEKLEDFEFEGKVIKASRLGYRVTQDFLFRYMGRVFDEPGAVFTEKMLKPELQDMEAFVDGVNNIVEAQEKVALNYFADNSVEGAIPPVKVLLHMMAYGHYEGKDLSDQELRNMFDREVVLNSDWYKARLVRKQEIDTHYYEKEITYLNDFISKSYNEEYTEKLALKEKLEALKTQLVFVKSDAYLDKIYGTIGADILYKG